MHFKEPEDSESCSHNQACHWSRSKADKYSHILFRYI